ncbi:MAG: NAD-dependent succinate-semialdehyde dehydrogenase [Prochlorotrichaceae cyanobacterium]
MAIATINPATGGLIKEFSALTEEELEQKLACAAETFRHYRQSAWSDRSEWLNRAAALLEAQTFDLAQMITLEMGKPLRGAIAEVEKCALVCRFYAENAAVFLAPQSIVTDGLESGIRYDPLGIVLAVMPWNFPLWQVFRFAAPALMAGNVGLLKHASNVPQCALAIESILLAAGFPLGAFQTLLIGADRVAGVVKDDRIRAATLTGSEAAGSSLAATAGEALKKTVLELGGSDPFIVMESADLERAVAAAATARLLNNGQSCIAAKRFLIQETIALDFLEQLTEKFNALTIGDPLDLSTEVGPLATLSILQELDQQVQACVRQGARVVTGGYSLQGSEALPEPLRLGHFYAPTILTDLPLGCPAYQEEFFGPVALVFPVANLEEAIVLANSTSFGLGASAWTQDPGEKEQFLARLEAGAVFINGMVKSDPRLPFGGIKRSGYGRELGAEGIREFVNVKTIWVGE